MTGAPSQLSEFNVNGSVCSTVGVPALPGQAVVVCGVALDCVFIRLVCCQAVPLRQLLYDVA